MLINGMISVAFKNTLEQYDVERISLFNIVNINEYYPNIHCIKTGSKEVKISVKCPVCNDYHYYGYNINDFIKRAMVIGGCEKIGLPILFIGKMDKVEEQVDKYRETKKEIYAMI